MSLVLALLAAYALGSIPAAYLAGQSKGIDLRKHGSGNLGATNVFRVLGPRIGTAVFLFDMLKGAVPVLVFWRWVDPAIASPVIVRILCGIAAIAGHVRPMWLRFGKGGKGVATAGGVFLALAPLETSLALVAFAVTLLASGYVSLGSMMAAVLLPVLLFIREGPGSPLFIVCAVIALFVFWTHRANIERLRQGTENRFGKRGTRRAPAVLVALGVVSVIAIYAAMRIG
ncbi:MAG TPA: glycerol-3-phosphate 1-O-acyltransferase PlsY [Gemmatimonadaceae bacterium]|nr:glycerol-3-phosphate 1-O-acyltransferase PlsY [Gemmatimonadaceae bacterium]